MSKKFKRIFKLVVASLLVVLSIVFAATNLETTKISYLVGSREIYVCVLVFVSLFAGGIIGALFSYPAFLRLKRENTRLKKQLEKANKPDTLLRAIPLQKQA